MKVVAFVVGQSNERGNCKIYPALYDGVSNGGVCETKVAEYGFPNVSDRAYWPYATELLWKTDSANILVHFNTAKGGSSIVHDWCGTAGTVPYSMVDGGFDPNNMLSGTPVNTTSSAINGDYASEDCISTVMPNVPVNGFDEQWVFLAIGNNDSNRDTTRANFAQGYINIIEWCLANGIDKVFVGLSPPSRQDDDNGYETELDPGIQDVLEHYASNNSVFEGANLWRKFSGNASVCWDNNHLDQDATIAAGKEWAKVISNSLANGPSVYY